jgi:predicted signal transduction protein with EAL and GGDEF domain
VAQKVRAQVRAPIAFEGLSVSITTSIAFAEESGRTDAADLMARADEALYSAKRAGRGAYAIAGEPVAGHLAPPADIVLAAGQEAEPTVQRLG